MNRYLFLLLLFTLGACRSTRLPDIQSQDLLLEAQVHRLIQCLNDGDEACLNQLYAENFRSIAPLMEVTSRADLVRRTVSSFRQNGFTADIHIQELRATTGMGYVVLEYRLSQTGADGRPQLYLRQQRLDLWIWRTDAGWQLSRTLFYEPDQF